LPPPGFSLRGAIYRRRSILCQETDSQFGSDCARAWHWQTTVLDLNTLLGSLFLGVTRHRAVLPFDPDPRLLGAFLALAMTAAAVVMGLALRRLIGRFLPEDDPRRQLIAQAMLYRGTFIIIAMSVWLRHH
jgi:hypothetical protein